MAGLFGQFFESKPVQAQLTGGPRPAFQPTPPFREHDLVKTAEAMRERFDYQCYLILSNLLRSGALELGLRYTVQAGSMQSYDAQKTLHEAQEAVSGREHANKILLSSL